METTRIAWVGKSYQLHNNNLDPNLLWAAVDHLEHDERFRGVYISQGFSELL